MNLLSAVLQNSWPASPWVLAGILVVFACASVGIVAILARQKPLPMLARLKLCALMFALTLLAVGLAGGVLGPPSWDEPSIVILRIAVGGILLSALFSLASAARNVLGRKQ